jgi:hypothetical protein
MSGSTHNDGGPAFPMAFEPHSETQQHDHGMTLRDYFAGQALAAIPLRDDGKRAPHEDRKQEAMWVATAAYRYADAMLKAREESK